MKRFFVVTTLPRALASEYLTAEYIKTVLPFGFNIHFFLGLLTGGDTAVDKWGETLR